MKRFILTGAPGSGKTSILRVLAATGYAVVDEAATDVMAARLAAGDTEPWTGTGRSLATTTSSTPSPSPAGPAPPRGRGA